MSGAPLAVVRPAVVVVLVAYLLSALALELILSHILLCRSPPCALLGLLCDTLEAVSVHSVACTNIIIYSSGLEHQTMS